MITIELQVHEVATDGLPDADTDVLIFDKPDAEAQLGAYVGHDEDGPLWVDAQGEGVNAVMHWAELPRLGYVAHSGPANAGKTPRKEKS